MMKKNLQAHEVQLLEGIDTLLRSNWPPAARMPSDAYQHCLQEVFHLVLGNVSHTALAQYLHDIAIERINWKSPLVDHMPVAERIRKLKAS